MWQQGPAEKACAYFLHVQIANHPQFILNRYQEVDENSAHTVTPKKQKVVKTGDC